MPTKRTRVEVQSLPPSAPVAVVVNGNDDAPGEARRPPPPAFPSAREVASSTGAKLLARAERGQYKKKLRGGEKGGKDESPSPSSLRRRKIDDCAVDARGRAAGRSASLGGVAGRSRKRKRAGEQGCSSGVADDAVVPECSLAAAAGASLRDAAPTAKQAPPPAKHKKQPGKGRWLESEDKILIESQREHGNNWANFQQLLPGRSGNAMVKRWKSKCIQDKVVAMRLRGEPPTASGDILEIARKQNSDNPGAASKEKVAVKKKGDPSPAPVTEGEAIGEPTHPNEAPRETSFTSKKVAARKCPASKKVAAKKSSTSKKFAARKGAASKEVAARKGAASATPAGVEGEATTAQSDPNGQPRKLDTAAVAAVVVPSPNAVETNDRNDAAPTAVVGAVEDDLQAVADDGAERCEICGKAVAATYGVYERTAPHHQRGVKGYSWVRGQPPGASLGGPVLRFEPLLPPRAAPALTPPPLLLLPSESRPVTVHLSCGTIALQLGRPDLVVGSTSNLAGRYRFTAAPGFREAMADVRKASYGGKSFYLEREFEERKRRFAAAVAAKGSHDGNVNGVIAVREWPAVAASEASAASDERPPRSADEANEEGCATAGEVGGVGEWSKGSPPSQPEVHARYSLAARSLLPLERRLLSAFRALQRAQLDHSAALRDAEAGRAERDAAAEAVVGDEIANGKGQWWELYRTMDERKGKGDECYFGGVNGTKRRKYELWEGKKSKKAAAAAKQGDDGGGGVVRDEDVGASVGFESDSAALIGLSEAEEGAGLSEAEGAGLAETAPDDPGEDTFAPEEDAADAEEKEAYRRLQRFASQCRSSRRRGRMDWIRVAALERLDFEWDESEAQWRTWYRTLKDFKVTHGHVEVPVRQRGGHGGMYDGLACWLSEQRRLWRRRDKRKGEGEGEGVEIELELETAIDGDDDKDGTGGAKGGDNCLSDERVRLLQDLGVPREPPRRKYKASNGSGARWNKNYEDLKKFWSENGSGAEIPADRPGLRNWVKRQRHVLRHKVEGRNDSNVEGTSEERIRLLEEIGVTAESVQESQERKWKAKYDELKVWRDENGDGGGGHVKLLPTDHALCPWLGRNLAGWRAMLASGSKQRKDNNAVMTEDRALLLEDLGLTPHDRVGASDKQWRGRYGELEAYHKENGQATVPKGHPLRGWVERQMTLWRKKDARDHVNSLSDERVNLLAELGLTTRSFRNTVAPYSDECWLVNFEKLRQYRRTWGDCNVSWNYEEDPKLGVWVLGQRYALRKYEKNPSDCTGVVLERVKALLDLGLEAKASTVGAYRQRKSDEKWDMSYRDLIAYHTEHGNLNAPRSGDKATKRLSRWIEAQRGDYTRRQKGDKKSHLSDERIAKLTAIGFTFVRQRLGFDDHFNLLVEYKNIHNHTRVPVHYKGHGKLGEWTKMVRETYPNGEMPDPPRKNCPDDAVRLAKLRGIGFDFERRKRGVLGRGDADDSKFTMPIRQMNLLQNGHAH